MKEKEWQKISLGVSLNQEKSLNSRKYIRQYSFGNGKDYTSIDRVISVPAENLASPFH